MWHTIVATLDGVINRLITGFVTTCHLYPIVTSCCLATFAILTIAFWLELLQIRRSVGATSAEAPIIRLKR